MSLERLTPGSLVELDDLVMKGRKLGLVDDTGVGYFDIHADGEIPKPLHSDLKPESLGDIGDWKPLDPEEGAAFVEAWEVLTNRGLDLLTLARAMRWGVVNGAYDPETLEKMGKAQTELIVSGRQAVLKSVSA